jgi:uncharacterized protein YeaO (DUF488 family)
VAPSDKLRHWFNHDPERRPEFRKRAELAEKSEDTKSEDMKSEDLKSGGWTVSMASFAQLTRSLRN